MKIVGSAAVLGAMLALTACGGSHRGVVSPGVGKTHARQRLTYTHIATLESGPECAHQHAIVSWTLLVDGRHRCAPSARVLRVFRAYLATAACLRRPAPNGTSCLVGGSYTCMTWNWRSVPRIKTLVQCTAGRTPKTATVFAAWSPRARH